VLYFIATGLVKVPTVGKNKTTMIGSHRRAKQAAEPLKGFILAQFALVYNPGTAVRHPLVSLGPILHY